jgi:hypothetical protein
MVVIAEMSSDRRIQREGCDMIPPVKSNDNPETHNPAIGANAQGQNHFLVRSQPEALTPDAATERLPHRRPISRGDKSCPIVRMLVLWVLEHF